MKQRLRMFEELSFFNSTCDITTRNGRKHLAKKFTSFQNEF